MRFQISSQAREFVARCVATYFSRLPAALLTGVLRPAVPPPAAYHPEDDAWPLTVAPKARVGKVGAEGLVRWKPLTQAPGTFSPVLYKFEGPPLLEAYLTSHRAVRLLIRTGERSFLLAETPVQDPTFGMNKLLRRWGDIYWEAQYLPFGFAEDGSALLCCDCSVTVPGQDSPVVALPTEPLFRMGDTFARSAIEPLTERLFPSFRALLSECLLKPGRAWGRDVRCPFERVAVRDTAFTPFDWEPFLTPDVGPDQEVRPARRGKEIPPEQIDVHLERIASKIALLRSADPALLILKTEYHRYRMNPVLLDTERRAFERAEQAVLPEIYVRFLMKVGNGGFGPGFGLARLEDSEAEKFARVGLWKGNPASRLKRPFRHRKAWTTPVGRSDDPYAETPEDRESSHIKQTYGTVLLGRLIDEKLKGRSVWLVVSGPERGHVWLEDTGRSGMIYPLVRRGPFSFLAWYEQALDYLLAAVADLYADIPSRTKDDFIRIRDRAFRMSEEFILPRGGTAIRRALTGYGLIRASASRRKSRSSSWFDQDCSASCFSSSATALSSHLRASPARPWRWWARARISQSAGVPPLPWTSIAFVNCSIALSS
jgi:hypothetical protein